MLRCTTREPNPFTGCIHEQEANEPPACAYCGNEVAEEGDYCSELCQEVDNREADADRRTTEFVRVVIRTAKGRRATLWAKPLTCTVPGRRMFLKVNDQGETPSSFNERTNVVTETKHIYIASECDVVSEEPAFMSLKYGELET